MTAPERLQFANGSKAWLLRVEKDTPPAAVLHALALPQPRALLCFNGGTATLEPELAAQLKRIIQDGIARVAAEESITLLTGGTDAGIFALLGQAFAQEKRSAPCLGVVPQARINFQPAFTGDTELEPHHSHFVAVEGDDWGDETAMMYALAAELGRECRSVTVFAGGGGIAAREMLANVQQDRTMIFLAGSGRKTDEVLAVRAGGASSDLTVRRVASEGRIVPFDLQQPVERLAHLIRQHLIEPNSGTP